jgi:CRP/FNR family cyclic AMP-dependent transcriptional regulator
MACEQIANFSSSKSAARPCSNLPHRTGETLAGVEVFRHLPPDALHVLSARCRWHRYHAHQMIVQCQDKNRDVFFLVSGRACVVYHSASGDEISFHDLRAGDMFGEFAAIDGRPRSADVIALSEALIARMTAETFRDVLRQYETVTAATLRRLTVICRTLLGRII